MIPETRGNVDLVKARGLVDLLRQAFEADLAAPAPTWLASPGEDRGTHALVVEDDPDQRSIVAAGLRRAGYTEADVGPGEDALTLGDKVRKMLDQA